MSWDDVVASTESTHCTFCGTDFDNLWDLRYQLRSVKTGAPLNLWCCDACVPTATTSGFRVRLDGDTHQAPVRLSKRARALTLVQIFALTFPITISALIAFSIVSSLLAIAYIVYASTFRGWF